MQHNLTKARLISRALENSGYYTCLSQIHHPNEAAKGASVLPVISNTASRLEGLIGASKHEEREVNESDAEYYIPGLPVVSFRFSDDFKQKYPGIKQAWIQLQLRGIGWIVPK
jgi:glutamate decarboxylase